MRTRDAALGCLLAALASACGARTGLREDPADPPPDAALDVALDAALDTADAPVDVALERPVDVRPPGCSADQECEDGVGCTRGRCDLATRRCSHAPDDALCPISHRCDVTRGCVARALVNTSTDLFEVELPSGALRSIGPVRAFTDVALHPDRTLYAVTSRGELWRVDASTAGSVFDASTGREFTALDAAPDGALYAAGPTGLFRINPATGTAVLVASFPTGLESSGDLAFLGGRLLATARTSAASFDVLTEFDVEAGTSRVLGPIGFGCVWGLAAFGPTLYGFTCSGSVLLIDPSTGAARELSRSRVMFYGATAR